MSPLTVLLAIAVGGILIVVIAWRLLVRRFSLPCPPALIWMLEHRIMENVAGSATIIERARVAPGMSVLDAGCGPGRVTIPLAQHVGQEGRVVALDLQAEMLAQLTRRLTDEGLTNVSTVHAGLGQGRLEQAAFDRAIMITVLGEIPDRSRALREVHDALKPGGLLSVTELLPDPHYQRRGTVRRLAEEVGFAVEEAYVGWRSYTMNLIRTRTV
jgi:ubiquinone/menaquinone biosynthesis C-methylase UbiE